METKYKYEKKESFLQQMNNRKKTQTPDTFFMFFRKRGVMDSLTILMNHETHEMTQKNFFEALKIQDAYPNLFFRVKSTLLEKKLIKFRLDSQNNKVITLTEKGILFMKKIHQLNSVIMEID